MAIMFLTIKPPKSFRFTTRLTPQQRELVWREFGLHGPGRAVGHAVTEQLSRGVGTHMAFRPYEISVRLPLELLDQGYGLYIQ